MIQEHQGLHYIQLLKQLHKSLQPEYYLEIGSSVGHSLNAADCDSIAIDPDFQFTSNPCGERKKTFLFQETSDSFFQNENVFDYFPHIDLAFLDGLHLFEFLLRDFINVEPYLKRNSVVLLHDCLPLTEDMAKRSGTANTEVEDEKYKGWWTGDVWKMYYVLKELRPEIKITALDCPPTGILMLTNFDPSSPILSEQYFDIVDKYMKFDQKKGWLEKLRNELKVHSSEELVKYPNLYEKFWL